MKITRLNDQFIVVEVEEISKQRGVFEFSTFKTVLLEHMDAVVAIGISTFKLAVLRGHVAGNWHLRPATQCDFAIAKFDF